MDAFYELGDKLVSYWISAAWDSWLIPVLAILSYLLLRVVLSKLFNRSTGAGEERPDQPTAPSRFYNLSRASIWAGSFVALALTAYLSYLSQKVLGDRAGRELISLLTLLLFLILPIIGLISLRARFARFKLKDLSTQARTPTEEENSRLSMIRYWRRCKLVVLLPLLGLLFYLWPTGQPAMVTVVFDNSGSMSGINQQARQALDRSLPMFPPGSMFVLGSFNGPGKKRTMEELMLVDEENFEDQLAGDVKGYRTAESVIRYVGNLSYNQPSPISEAIWKSYLFGRKYARGISARVLLVLTDGDETDGVDMSKAEKFFDSDSRFTEWFPPTRVHFFDATTGQVQPKLFELARRANYQFVSSKSVGAALRNIFRPFMTDWYLFLVTTILVVAAAVVALVISPASMKRVN